MKIYFFYLIFASIIINLAGCKKTDQVLTNKSNVWVYSTSADERVAQIIQTRDGGYAIFANYKQNDTAKSKYLLIKTDQKGKQLWRQEFGDKEILSAVKCVENSDGHLILGGNKVLPTGYAKPFFIFTDDRGNRTGDLEYQLPIPGRLTDFKPIPGGELAAFSYDYAVATGVGFGHLLVKLNPNCKATWVKEYPRYYNAYLGNSSNYNFGATLLKDGSVVNTGYFASVFGFGSQTDPSLDIKVTADVMLLETDVNHKNTIRKLFRGPKSQVGRFVEPCPDNSLVVTGIATIQGERILDPMYGDLLIIKTNSKGDSLWTRHLDDGVYTPFGMTTVSDNGFIVLALSQDRINLIKYDLNGNILWHKTNLPFKTFNTASFVTCKDGTIAIAGSTNGAGLGKNNYDIVAFKVSADGELLNQEY